jgi:protein-S-isoprenylcysteine O-methyltransferase Ste14
METRLSRFGIGPRIVLATATYAALASAATYFWPGMCLLQWLPRGILLALGTILVVLGIPMWLVAAVTVMRAYNRDQLVTSGVFAACRHPLYAAWIVLILPGLTLPTRSWPLMLTPLMAYAVFKRLIHKEDDYLELRFGAPYLEYRKKVNEIIPIPKV